MIKKDNKMEKKTPISIWFFVGIVLLVYGIVLIFSGLFEPQRDTALAHLKPNLWWGGVMAFIGIIFIIINRKLGGGEP